MLAYIGNTSDGRMLRMDAYMHGKMQGALGHSNMESVACVEINVDRESVVPLSPVPYIVGQLLREHIYPQGIEVS